MSDAGRHNMGRRETSVAVAGASMRKQCFRRTETDLMAAKI